MEPQQAALKIIFSDHNYIFCNDHIIIGMFDTVVFAVLYTEALPGVLGIQGEGLFIFRD